MSKITLGYADSEDRIWLLLRDEGVQLWLTRRLTGSLLAKLVQLMEKNCPGGDLAGALPAATRLELEHEAAMEMAQEQAEQEAANGGPEPDAPVKDVASYLVNGIDLRVTGDRLVTVWHAPGLSKTLDLNRADGHRTMRAIARRTRYAQWNFTHLPDWLMTE